MRTLKEFKRKQINKSGEVTYNDRLLIYSQFKIKRKSTGEIFNTNEDYPLDISKDIFNDFEDTNELAEVIEDEIS